MVVRWMVVCLAFASLAACEQKSEPTTVEPVARDVPAAPVDSATPVAATAEHVHSVACGCSLGQECGNMIEVEGKYVPLGGELGLGDMEFCGKKDLKAKVEGELKDGTYVATSFELVQ